MDMVVQLRCRDRHSQSVMQRSHQEKTDLCESTHQRTSANKFELSKALFLRDNFEGKCEVRQIGALEASMITRVQFFSIFRCFLRQLAWCFRCSPGMPKLDIFRGHC